MSGGDPAASLSQRNSASTNAAQREMRQRQLLWFIPAALHAIGEFIEVLLRGLRLGRWRRTMHREFGRSLYQVGFRAIPAVLVAALLVAAGLVVQIIYWLGFVGEEERVGEFLVLILVRGVAPVVTALIVIGRSGSVLVDEIGQMKLGGQLRLMESYGVDPVDFITIPRSFAMAVSLLLLTILFMHASLWFGFLVTSIGGLTNLSAQEFMISVLGEMGINDHLLLIVKPLITGYVVGYISIWLGMRVEDRTLGIRRALPKAFVYSLLATFAIGAIASAVF